MELCQIDGGVVTHGFSLCIAQFAEATLHNEAVSRGCNLTEADKCVRSGIKE